MATFNVQMLAWFGTAFGFGLIHALDPDHLATVAGLSALPSGKRATPIAYCGRWAMGHAVSLLLLGLIVLLIGLGLPQSLGSLVDGAIGLLLLGLGGGLLLALRVHHHDHQPLHGHGLVAEGGRPPHRHGRRALGLGALHGTSGSAAILALLPAQAAQAPWLGLVYLGLFSLGVFIAMLLIGTGLGQLLQRMDARGLWALRAVRLVIGVGAMATGLALLLASG